MSPIALQPRSLAARLGASRGERAKGHAALRERTDIVLEEADGALAPAGLLARPGTTGRAAERVYGILREEIVGLRLAPVNRSTGRLCRNGSA